MFYVLCFMFYVYYGTIIQNYYTIRNNISENRNFYYHELLSKYINLGKPSTAEYYLRKLIVYLVNTKSIEVISSLSKWLNVILKIKENCAITLKDYDIDKAIKICIERQNDDKIEQEYKQEYKECEKILNQQKSSNVVVKD